MDRRRDQSAGQGEIILYSAEDGQQIVQLRSLHGSVWLTQGQLVNLYGTSLPNIAQIIKRILADGEVTDATINSELIVRTEGNRQVRRSVSVYNLDMILAIGYRVSTPRAVQFRQWATTTLKDYLLKGFAINDGYLKDPGGIDYFDELLERVRSIRASEKRFYQKVRDIFAQTSADYSADSEMAKTFFATIQNKLIFAVTGHTAAELIVKRFDPTSTNMGLQTWAGAHLKRADTYVAKNYLKEPEIKKLDRLTTMFLDFAEDRAGRRQQMLMADWIKQADRFLNFNERAVLADSGKVSNSAMKSTIDRKFDDMEASRRAEEANRSVEIEAVDLNELLRKTSETDRAKLEIADVLAAKDADRR